MSDEQGHDPLLEVRNLAISLKRGSKTRLVRNASFSAPTGSITALVGKSGSGKSLTVLALMGLLDATEFAVTGDIVFSGCDTSWNSANATERVRGTDIGLVFQDPSAHLNPLLTIGAHIEETLLRHSKAAPKAAWEQVLALLREMKFDDAAHIAKAYPHELSGGQKQRAMIAMAIAGRPRLLIADEPTSALDVTIQRDILSLLSQLRERHGLTILMVTHDLELASQFADQIVVMHAGEVVESGEARILLRSPRDPHTRSLVAARRRLGDLADLRRMSPARPVGEHPRLTANGLAKTYRHRALFRRASDIEALQPLSLALHRGETIAVVGESGSGKSTLAKLLMRLLEPSMGAITVRGRDVTKLSPAELRPARRVIQMVFQDPHGALDPERTIAETLTEPMQVNRIGSSAAGRRARARELLQKVGLDPSALERLPTAFSGGERQRISIARCLAVDPEIIVCDECVSALDADSQVQILELLARLQGELGLSYIFVSHDLEIVRYISDRVIVLKGGEVVEEGPTMAIFDAPSHAYTAALLGFTP